ncbi:hypothetical protein LEP1GSC186_4620 [Leptospira noguchii serovar Autumnalis str. ZUN142]|uniref:Uncharacterized protein n=1 Tax=Leptospira noguchii serovar Autumnalis str. ZUN142 TaxID=1085540 RepID=M6UPF4_9LEPT|nr:hypothetical protein LEP1GSC186_4620 [Leptospira noguchii serovar Autumnalis str. ZUN142]
MKFASDSPQFSYIELTLSFLYFKQNVVVPTDFVSLHRI